MPTDKISVRGGFTKQSSKYEEAQEFDEKRLFRTPDDYGYFMMDLQPVKNFGIYSTGNFIISWSALPHLRHIFQDILI